MAIKKYIIKSKCLNIRKKNSLDGEVVGIIKEPGKLVNISVTRNGFGKLADCDGWICLDFAEKV